MWSQLPEDEGRALPAGAVYCGPTILAQRQKMNKKRRQEGRPPLIIRSSHGIGGKSGQLQDDIFPELNPLRNHSTRWADVPCVNESGTT